MKSSLGGRQERCPPHCPAVPTDESRSWPVNTEAHSPQSKGRRAVPSLLPPCQRGCRHAGWGLCRSFLDHEALDQECQSSTLGEVGCREPCRIHCPASLKMSTEFRFYCINDLSSEAHAPHFPSIAPSVFHCLPSLPLPQPSSLYCAAGLNLTGTQPSSAPASTVRGPRRSVGGASHTCSEGSHPSAEANTFWTDHVAKKHQRLTGYRDAPSLCCKMPLFQSAPARALLGPDEGNSVPGCSGHMLWRG